MKILWTTINVNDLDESLEFYDAVLGVKNVNRFPAGPDREIAMIGDGEAKLEMICDHKREVERVHGVSMGYPVADLDVKRAELLAAGYEPSEIISPNPHIHFFFLQDPNGINIQFVQQG